MLLAGEVYGAEGAKVLAGFPADLFAKAGGVASGPHVAQLAQELEEDGLEKIPIFSTTGKKAAEPQLVALSFVDINDGEVALSAGGNIEAETEGALGLKEFKKAFASEIDDFLLPIALVTGTKLAELVDDLAVFEM